MASSAAATGGVTKSKEGIPQWQGDPASYQDYEEQCLLYEQATPFHKRYLVGPRLIGELQGAARRLVVGKPADWVSYPGGVQVLLDSLRASLGKPKVSDLAEQLNKYFKQSKRRHHEAMGDYITKKCEAYLRAQQALRRVMPQVEERKYPNSWQQWPSYWGGNWSSSRRSSGESETSGETESQAAAPVAEEAPSEVDSGQSSWTWSEYYGSWNWQNGWVNKWYPQKDWRSGGYPQDSTGSLPGILPDCVQGWMLLADAGLDQNERNLIHTAVGGDYSLQRVAQELRTQWGESEVRRREGPYKTQAGYWGNELSSDEAEDGCHGRPQPE